jgi:predicted exporter
MASVRRGFTGSLPVGVAPVTPRRYYNSLLTSLSKELGWLFLAGLAVMAIYLAWLQRSVVKVLYVFSPLALASLAFALWARLGGFPINILHVMGASLVIALAIDYTAVAVSSDHAPEENSKVLLTGLSTLATFGVLAFACHPVLRGLGFTVLLGCGLSLLLALFLRVEPSGRTAQ